MPAPPVHTNGRDQLDDARPAAAIDIATKHGIIPVRAPRLGSWHPEAFELEPAELRDPDPDPDTQPLPSASTPPPAAPRKRSKSTLSRLRLTQQALALRVQGLSMVEIGTALGVSAQTVTGWFATHRRQVVEGSIDAMLDEIAVPIAAENLVQGLLAGDKDYTLETLKGRGQLKRHTAGDARPSGDLPALSIIFEAPVAVQVNTAGLPQGKILGRIGPAPGDTTMASAQGGADYDVIDAAIVPVSDMAARSASERARAQAVYPDASRLPTALGIGQPAGVTVPIPPLPGAGE